MRLALTVAFLVVLLAWLMASGLALSQQGKVVSSKHDVGATGYLAGVSACETCHDGTVTGRGTYTFDLDMAQHPLTPGKAGEDCDMCHDPHVPDYGNFFLFPAGANLCKACHARGGEGDHPLNVDVLSAGYIPQDARW